jgi:hypothetical protein
MLIHEIIENVSKKKTKEEKIELLKQHESWALKDVLRGAYDSSIEWNMPKGNPPFTKNQDHNAPSNLLRENTKFKYFVKGGPGDKMPKFKREKIFIGLLESIHPKDAELVVGMINKSLPVKGITKNLVKEAFPNLIKD